jgi:hypothetical protein
MFYGDQITVENVKLLASVSFEEIKLLTMVAKDLHGLLDSGRLCKEDA